METGFVGVVGAGQIGRGVVQAISAAVPHVILCDINDAVLEEAVAQITWKLNEAVTQGKLTEWVKEKTLKNLRLTSRLEDLARCDIILEFVPEKEEIKFDLFEALDEICPKETLFASGTSSMSITRLASVTSRPEQFIGVQFMHPVQERNLVEIVPGWRTSDATFTQIKTFIERLGKNVIVSKDTPGFITHRILMPMINEAVFTLMEGVGSAETIDRAMVLGALHPIGPLALADQIGLDTCLDVMEILFTEFGDSKYRPAPLLRKYVEADMLGQKTGRGFYRYEEAPSHRQTHPDASDQHVCKNKSR